KATEHLIAMGHRRIGILDAAGTQGNREKTEGYQQALAAAGIGFDQALAVDPSGDSPGRGYRAMEVMMSGGARPTAVFAANDSLAIGALNWCLHNGLIVPDDVAIIGFDNIEFAEFGAVPLSSVNYAVGTVTELAVERLMQLIASGDRLPGPEVTLIDPELVIRSEEH